MLRRLPCTSTTSHPHGRRPRVTAPGELADPCGARRPRRRRRSRRPRQARRARPGDVPPPVLGQPAADDPARRDQRDGDGLVRLRARLRRACRGSGRCSARSCSGGAAGRSSPAASAEVRDRQPGMMLLISMAITVAYVASMATQPRLARPRVLVGAGGAGDDHAARPLAGDEGDRPGPRRPRRAGRAAARRRRGGRRRRRPHGAASTSCASATSCWCGPAAGSRPTA